MNRSLLTNCESPGRASHTAIRSLIVLLLFVVVIVLAKVAGLSLVEVAALLGIVVAVLTVAERVCDLAPASRGKIRGGR